MTVILLIIIYIAYIGLGIPDSVFGAAWPAIYRDFDIPVSYSSYVTMLVYAGTIISSLISARLIAKIGTGRVGAISTILTAAALFFFSKSPGIFSMCILALPLGLGAGAVDAAMNNYVALHYSNTQMNFLHCFYGVGVAVSPYFMSVAMNHGGGWRGGYTFMFIIQSVISLIMLVSLPLWKKVNTIPSMSEEPQKLLTIRQMLNTSSIRSLIGVMMFSCSIESVCLVWGATFLADGRGMTPAKAAEFVTLYFVGLALGRFISGLLSSKLTPSALVYAGQAISAVSLVILMIPNGGAAVAGLFLIGFGNGSLFPNMTLLIPAYFGRDISRSVIGLQMGMCYFAIMLVPPLFGIIARNIGAYMFPYYVLILFIIMIICTLMLNKRIKKFNKSEI